MSTTLPPPIKRLAYSVPEAVVASGIGRTTLYQLMDDGELPYTKVRARRLIPVAALERLIAEGVPMPKPKPKRR